MIRLFDRSTHRSAATAPSASLSVLFAGCIAALSACDLSDSGAVSLQIVKPVDGQTFTSKDDVDGKTDGTQIDVTVAVVGVDADAIVELYRLQAGEPVAPTIATATITDNEAVFGAFTLQAGENELQARIKDSERTSESISVKFEDSCGSLAFVEPAGSVDEVRLGPSDDQDDEECGDTFTTRVVASTGLSDGTEVALLVNGKASRTQDSKGGVVTFDDVVLGNRGNTPNKLALQITGSGCGEVELEADVFVACEGPSCSLGGPTGPDLSSADDKDSATAGLQIDFDVQTDTDGQDVMLLINGDADNAKTSEVSGGEASFAAVSLPEGRGVRVKAVCTGANGLTGTDERVFNIDTTACAVAITSPEANEEFRAEQASADVAPSETRDINVTATVGSDCVSFQIAPLEGAGCDGIADVEAEALTAGQTAITTDLTLETQGNQHVCVQVSDSAGNTSVASVPVSFDKTAPELNFTSPAAALSVNVAGTGGRVADQNTATPTCDRAMTVSCSENGATVQILTATDKVQLASAACTGGVATFAAVPLPTKNDGSSYDIIARSTGTNGLVGTSAPRTITADCQPQALSFLGLTCGARTIRSSDDADLATPGIQFDIRLENTPLPRPNLSLTLDGAPANPATSVTTDTGAALFDNVTFTLGTTPTLRACAQDAGGNASCSSDCQVIVGDVPTVAITTPSGSGVLTRDLSGQGVAYRHGLVPVSSDCNAGTNGLQISVAATTNAPNGRAARIKLMPDSNPNSTAISTLTTTVAGGAVAGCIDTTDGENLVVRVEVDDVTPTVYGVATATVSIDGNAPSAAVVLNGNPPSCRGTASLTFTEVFDAPGVGGAQRRLVGWERHCSYSPIVDEASWLAGTPAPDSATVVDQNANPRTYNWSARTRPDTTRYCVVRGYDAANALTPLATAVQITAPALEERTLSLPACYDHDSNAGTACINIADGATDTIGSLQITAVGDVNDDTFEDVLVTGYVSARAGQAALYLGSATGLALTPAARFSSLSLNLGRSVTALGDFNNDGLDDFAMGASPRMVYVVFGRATWPAGVITVDAGGSCTADLCIGGDFAFGAAMAAVGTFDGDAIPDLAITQEINNVITVVRGAGSAVYPLNPNLGVAEGSCRDARTAPGTYTLACGGGTGSQPDGFRIFTPQIPRAIAGMGNHVYVAHRGGDATTAIVWAVARRSYTVASGLQEVGSASDFSQLSVVHDLAPSNANKLFDRALVSVGDFDGDGLTDLTAGIDTGEGRFYVYPGRAGAAAAFTAGAPAAQVGYVVNNNLAGSTSDAFGDDVALGYHPVFGLLGDIDNDGFGDILTSSQEEGATTAGSVDIFYGSTNKTLSRVRSGRDYAFNDTTLLNDAQTNATYWRRAEYIGDVDGDGNNDIAITEENYTNGGQNGRVLILGECNAP